MAKGNEKPKQTITTKGSLGVQGAKPKPAEAKPKSKGKSWFQTFKENWEQPINRMSDEQWAAQEKQWAKEAAAESAAIKKDIAGYKKKS